jgi:glycosyltransferase involved in cell wall biosynthesis
LIDIISSILPAVGYVHGFTAVCPGLGKYFRRGDVICERPFGWGCVPMHYLRRCSAARHPQTLTRLMRSATMLKRAMLKLPRFLVGSGYMADLLAQNGFPAEKIAVLPPHFLPDDASLIYAPPEEPGTVLFGGRLEIEKGFPYLLQAGAELPSAARLEVAGDGTQRSVYEALARDLGLEERIDFLGWLDSKTMEKAYQRCSLVAMPSICPESFGKIGIEALAHGRPVVAFDVGGISDWLDDGVNGYLVKSKDAMMMARRIDQLLGDKILRAQLGQAGQASVVRQFSSSRHLEILLATIKSARIAYE